MMIIFRIFKLTNHSLLPGALVFKLISLDIYINPLATKADLMCMAHFISSISCNGN